MTLEGGAYSVLTLEQAFWDQQPVSKQSAHWTVSNWKPGNFSLPVSPLLLILIYQPFLPTEIKIPLWLLRFLQITVWCCSVTLKGDRLQEYQNHTQDPIQTVWSCIFSLITSYRQKIVWVIECDHLWEMLRAILDRLIMVHGGEHGVKGFHILKDHTLRFQTT